jgi:hypothetical protein
MAAKAKTSKRSTGGKFKCPECGRTFTRAAALGAHRRQAHGVIGAVSAARAQRSRTTTSRAQRARTTSAAPARRKAAAAKTVSTSARTRGTRTTARTQTAARSRPATKRSSAAPRRDSSAVVNRDMLLGALFPNGLPAKEDVLRATNQWLDDAERLARMR